MSGQHRAGSLERLFEGDTALQRTLRAVAAATAASILVHTLMWALFSSAWLRPRGLSNEERKPRGTASVELVEAALLSEDELTDVSMADQVDPGREELAQGAPVADTRPVPIEPAPAPSPPPAAGMPSPKPEASGEASRPARRPSRAPRAPTSASASASPGVGSGKPDNTSGSPDNTGGDSGGPARERAPDLAARFTHDLPRWAADVPTWKTASPGDMLEAKFALELGPEGRPIVSALPEPPSDGALAESVARTKKALVTKLALPGRLVGAGVLRVSIRASVTDGPPRAEGDEVALKSSYDAEAKIGQGTFALRSGRSVTFHVRVLAVED